MSVRETEAAVEATAEEPAAAQAGGTLAPFPSLSPAGLTTRVHC